MPKMKSNRAAHKRFHATGGAGSARQAGEEHILSNKNRKRKRNLKKSALVHSATSVRSGACCRIFKNNDLKTG
jgi:large subunit ribosomal protein L35